MPVAAVETQDRSTVRLKLAPRDASRKPEIPHEACSASSAPRVRLLITLSTHSPPTPAPLEGFDEVIKHTLSPSRGKLHCTLGFNNLTRHGAAHVDGGINERAAKRRQELFVRKDVRLAPRVAFGEVDRE